MTKIFVIQGNDYMNVTLTYRQAGMTNKKQ
jgi:hypothetical protein